VCYCDYNDDDDDDDDDYDELVVMIMSIMTSTPQSFNVTRIKHWLKQDY